jgi:hypothetical protein
VVAPEDRGGVADGDLGARNRSSPADPATRVVAPGSEGGHPVGGATDIEPHRLDRDEER